jgi:CBS domain containing-hemolysin-like protein
LPEASFDFIGQESPLQQQHDIVVAAEPLVFVYANAKTPSPMTMIAAIASITFLFILFYLIIYKTVSVPTDISVSPAFICALNTAF